MIVVQLRGGLGNQMFQYAAGRALAAQMGTVLKLDISDYKLSPQRRYELHSFCASPQLATEAELACFQQPPYTWQERWALRLAGKLGFPHFVQRLQPAGRKIYEQPVLLLANFAGAAGDLYLIGYWQSEAYFRDIRADLLQEFSVKYPPNEHNRQTAAQIQSVNAVALHVRRGDYVQQPQTNQMHGVCGIDYYLRAVDYIVQRTVAPHFFIFSDDMEWVKANLHLDFPTTYVEHNTVAPAYADLRLMTLCRHHIIANSSYSWWGAWLANAGAEQIVVAPQRWFEDTTQIAAAIVPERWVRL